VCQGQWWRKTWTWSHTAKNSHMNCWMLTQIAAMVHVIHCWTLSWIPHSTQRFSSSMSAQIIAVPVTEMLCSGLRRIHIWQWSRNVTNYMWCYGLVWLQLLMLKTRELMDDVWLQQNRTPAHFTLTVLNKQYPGCWTGCGPPTSSAPLSWPAHSPDHSTLDNSLWDNIKG
jgi:hypothetical protein